MILKIAWRNIWRNRVRSLVIVSSIAVGLWAGAFMSAFTWGMYQQHINEVIQNQLSNIQVHHPGFEEDKETDFLIPEASGVIEIIIKTGNIKAASGRFIMSGMISSPSGVAGVKINGIDTLQEKKITVIHHKISEGKYFGNETRHPVLIGKKLAEKLKLKEKSKIVITLQDKDLDIAAGAFRVTGIYKTENSAFDAANIFIPADQISALAGVPGAINEIAVTLPDNDVINAASTDLKKKLTGLKVETWKELSPELELIVDSFRLYMLIFVGIILLALTFGIVNIMLMAVLERTREIGVLMAIGMNRIRLFSMIMTETIYLVLLGSPIGLILAYTSISITGKKGIDISAFSEGLSAYGFSSMIYPKLETDYYIYIVMMAITTAIISSIYPSVIALQLKPAVAIRKI